MFLTTRGRYAVMAVLDICKNNNGLPVSIASVSKRQNVSISYLEQIFLNLRKAEIMQSVRGPGGGYILAKSMSEISLYDILSASGERMKMTKCTQKDIGCTGLSGRCDTHKLWKEIGTNISTYFAKISIQDILDGKSVSNIL